MQLILNLFDYRLVQYFKTKANKHHNNILIFQEGNNNKNFKKNNGKKFKFLF